MSFNRFQFDKTKGAIGKPQSNGRYEYILGTEDGREILVESANPQLCRWSLREFYNQGLQRNKMDKMKERMRAKMEAKQSKSD